MKLKDKIYTTQLTTTKNNFTYMASRRSERRQFKAFFNLYLDVAEACSPNVDLSDPDTLMAIWKHANPPQDQTRRSSPRVKAFLDSLERNSAAKKNLKREFKKSKETAYRDKHDGERKSCPNVGSNVGPAQYDYF